MVTVKPEPTRRQLAAALRALATVLDQYRWERGDPVEFAMTWYPDSDTQAPVFFFGDDRVQLRRRVLAGMRDVLVVVSFNRSMPSPANHWWMRKTFGRIGPWPVCLLDDASPPVQGCQPPPSGAAS